MTDYSEEIEDDPDEIEITLDNIAEAIVNDFLETLEDCQKQTSTIQHDITHLRQKSSIILDNIIELPIIEADNISTKSRVTGADMIKTSLAQMSEKAARDIQFARLYDQYTVKQKGAYLRKECLEKYFKLIPQQVLSDFNHVNRKTQKAVNNIKSNVEEYLDLAQNEGNTVENTINQACEDFQEVNSIMQNEIERTKINVNEHFFMLFPPMQPPTAEELESQEFVKEHILEVSQKIKSDVISAKQMTDKLVYNTKKDISDMFQDNEHINRIIRRRSSEDFKRLESTMRESVLNIKQKISSMISIESQSYPKFMTKNTALENMKVYRDFQDTNEEMQEILRGILENSEDLRNTMKDQNFKMSREIKHILADIILATESIKNTMSAQNIKIQESVRACEKYVEKFKPDVKKTLKERINEIHENVEKVKAEIQKRVHTLNNDIQTKSSDPIDQNIKEKALEALEEAKIYSINTFRETEEKMNKDIEIIKLKVANHFEPFTKLLPKKDIESEIQRSPNISFQKTPNISLQNTPNASLEKTPNSSSQKIRRVSLKTTPNVSLEKTPSVCVEEQEDG